MSNGRPRLKLPTDLKDKLVGFQRRVWSIKLTEAVCIAILLTTISYLVIFASDRIGETSVFLRSTALAVGLFGWLVWVPLMLYRWVFRHRRLEDVARLLASEKPLIGDHLLGVIELSQNAGDKNASPALCQAAIEQVADDTREIDFLQFVPNPRHVARIITGGICCLLALGAFLTPGAGPNAMARWAKPLANIQRYTFAQLAQVPDELVVPIGESFAFNVPLSEETVWKPSSGKARFRSQSVVTTTRDGNRYTFEIPPQNEAGSLTLKIGDARHTIAVQPKPRPELTGILANVDLPDYLGYPLQQKDVRGGSVSIVKGSHASFEAKASRELREASINGAEDQVTLQGDTIKSPRVLVDETDDQQFTWTDVDGLSARAPFNLKIRPIDDRAPTIQCANLPAEKVILDEDVLTFEISSADDFGVRTVGVEWSGVEDFRRNPVPEKGEFVLTGGSHQHTSLEAQGTFGAKNLGIKPQPIDFRVYTEDYMPGRERVYSPTCRLYVLDREQHMIWITEKLHEWERQALEVRDQEERLFETNQELRGMSPDELNSESNRRKIARQAAAERANARRLGDLTISGEQLITEALRNDEFNVVTLEKWAKMLAVLKKLSQKDMPSVANLLGQAANAPASGGASSPSAPQVVDVEQGARQDPDDSENEKKDDDGSANSGSTSPGPPLGLPSTTLASKSQPGSGSCPAGQKMDQAVEEQEALLAEFNAIMSDLAKLLQELQGSTFVKRLKAAARSELSLAASLHDRLENSFGDDSTLLTKADQVLLRSLYVKQSDTATDVRLIQEDLAAYFERTQQSKFKTVHDEMKETKVVSSFKQMSTAAKENLSGETIAQAEYWSDQLDRWAEILVGPG
ncbi:MAG: hypothetical protein KDB27_06535 [Planctomycetales bacterium]|nr:hypothetical protein [Planctomycetales bacterium]